MLCHAHLWHYTGPWYNQGCTKNQGMGGCIRVQDGMVKIMEHPIKMDNLGVLPIFGNIHVCQKNMYISMTFIYRHLGAIFSGLLIDASFPGC